jgi:hypothetical protein
VTGSGIFVLASCIVLASACSAPSTSPVGFAGQWCGVVVTRPQLCRGDSIQYAEFSTSGAAVTGRMCEAFDKECYNLLEGSLSGSELTFYYTSGPDRVDAILTLSGDVLEGQSLSTKTSIPIVIKLHRIP